MNIAREAVFVEEAFLRALSLHRDEINCFYLTIPSQISIQLRVVILVALARIPAGKKDPLFILTSR